MELRASFDTLISLNVLGGDVLFTLKPGAGFKPYLGLGGLLAFPGSVAVDVVATLGAEFAPGSVGFFGEAKASVLALASGFFGPYYRAGINIHF